MRGEPVVSGAAFKVLVTVRLLFITFDSTKEAWFKQAVLPNGRVKVLFVSPAAKVSRLKPSDFKVGCFYQSKKFLRAMRWTLGGS